MRRPLAALVLLCLPACDAETTVNLYVTHEADCDTLHAVGEAVDAWADVADVGLATGECIVTSYPLDVTVHEREGGRLSAEGVERMEGELPVYVVERIDVRYLDGRVRQTDGVGTKVGCARGVAVVSPEPEIIAHEIGHVLGLGHDDRAGNLMDTPVPSAWWLDDEQIERAESMATACS